MKTPTFQLFNIGYQESSRHITRAVYAVFVEFNRMLFFVRALLAFLAVAGLAGLEGGSIGFAVSAQQVNPYNYTIINGQIFTPGLAIVDAPQPNTPLGGGFSPVSFFTLLKLTSLDFLQVALDVSYDGAIGLPPYNKGANTKIYNITIFLFSYDNGNNFTITNGTAGARNASLGNIMEQEPGSTVKHVNWNWPDCLVGNEPSNNGNSSSARGAYNVCFFPGLAVPP
jgi:hypothetical protein